MRAHQLNESNEIINTIEVPSLDFLPNLIDAALGGTIGDFYIDGHFIPPNPPPLPSYPPDTPEQAYLEYAGLIERRADALEASGDIVEALLLRESIK